MRTDEVITIHTTPDPRDDDALIELAICVTYMHQGVNRASKVGKDDEAQAYQYVTWVRAKENNEFGKPVRFSGHYFHGFDQFGDAVIDYIARGGHVETNRDCDFRGATVLRGATIGFKG